MKKKKQMQFSFTSDTVRARSVMMPDWAGDEYPIWEQKKKKKKKKKKKTSRTHYFQIAQN